MELMQQQVKGYSDSREDDDEEETAEIVTITREESRRLREEDEAASTNWMNQNHRKQQQQQELELMELSLGSNKEEEQGSGGAHVHGTPSSSNANEAAVPVPVEKEHMFDKVVTPSDVGKLNRLVIPKQHAEKYFPLDSSSNEKGLLLNFEDRNGKLWRFRYSYWNSSQSYVMTKGWSRFVKEKKLDAGDIVSFQRGVGELYRHRLYIDWRRRDHHHHHHHHAPDPSSSLINPFFLQNQYSIRWNARFYSLPSPPAPSAAVPQHFHHHLNYNNLYAFQQQQQQVIRAADYNSGGSGGGVYYLRSASEQQERERRVIIDSVPVAATHHHNQQYGSVGVTSGASGDATNSVTTTGKRLRLFGVNMECASSAEDSRSLSLDVTMATNPPNSSSIASSSIQHRQIEENSVRGSVLFDLDPSLQYRRH